MSASIFIWVIISSLHPYANFAFAFLIIVIHILYNDHNHITISQEGLAILSFARIRK